MYTIENKGMILDFVKVKAINVLKQKIVYKNSSSDQIIAFSIKET